MKRIIIGRDPEHPYPINDSSVSRNHAELIVDNKVITLKDLKSRNGTYVIRNRDRIPVDQATVSNSDQLVFGDSGPHLVSDIIFKSRHTTEVHNKAQLASNGIPTSAGKAKRRCVECGVIIEGQVSVCPDCGALI